jgi:putative DNA primase/helicase
MSQTVSTLEEYYDEIQKKKLPTRLQPNKNPTLHALPEKSTAKKDFILHQTYTESGNTALTPPDLTYEENLADGNSKTKLIIESKAAELLAEYFGDRLAYDDTVGEWYEFEGDHWRNVPKANPEQAITRAVFEGTDPIGFRNAYLSGIFSILKKSGTLQLPKGIAGVIPFNNGLLDLNTGELLAVSPRNALTWAIPHAYVKGAECPAFIRWAREALAGDDEMVELLRAFINACLTGRYDVQRFLYLFGAGGTGKSTFFRIMKALIGQANFVTTDLKNLEGNRFETAGLHGKKLAIITDAGRYSGSVDTLKSITGGDPVRLEKKNVQQGASFVFEGMVIIASNSHLAATDYTSGLARRELVVEFQHRFTAEEKTAFQQRGGEDAILAEIPVIINWALALPHGEVTRIFQHPPAACLTSTKEALFEQNPVADWIQQNLIHLPGFWTQVGVNKSDRAGGFMDADIHLYPNYLRWCAENKREAMALRRFRATMMDMLKTLGVDVIASRRGSGQGLTGVKIAAFRPYADDDTEVF